MRKRRLQQATRLRLGKPQHAASAAAQPPDHERERVARRLGLLTTYAPNIIWHGLVTLRDGSPPWCEWHTELLDEVAAGKLVAIDRLPGEAFRYAWWRARLPDDRQQVDTIATQALWGGQSHYQTEFRCRQHDGSVRWFAEQVFIEIRSQRTRYLVGVATDITERKQMEIALRASEERFRVTFEQAAVGIAHASIDGRYLLVNQRMCMLVGYTSEELLSTSYQAITYADDLEADQTLARRLLAGTIATYTLEKRFIRKDGGLTWANTTVSLARDSLGQPEYFISVLEDINERKQLATQLLQLQKMESIGRLAGGIAHDFNNLLTVMIGNVALAHDSLPADSPAHDDLREIDKAAARATRLTQQLLAFARKQALAPRVLVLNELILDAEHLLRRLIGEHIELVLRLDANLWRVRVDPGQLEQVLINLAVNARDAMPNGGQLFLTTANRVLGAPMERSNTSVAPGPYVVLTVSDTGVGIPAELQTRVFDPFFTTKAPGDGTGLGLATCYGIVKQHGGNIWVHSTPGQGTEFTIYLPQVDQPADPRQPAEAEPRLPTGTETILLVEDEDAVRALATRVLRTLGYSVLTASSGVEALHLIQMYTMTFQLALIDVIMPEMGGKELSVHLRQLDPAIKVVFMSGYTDDAFTHGGWVDAAIELLHKPFTPATLAQKVRAVLDA